MRAELYRSIAAALKRVGEGAIRHVDLWNRNVEFISQESAWPTPAVFVEFEPIAWQALVSGVEYRAEARFRLHIVTEWTGSQFPSSPDMEMEPGMPFDLPDMIHRELAGLEGDGFTDLRLAESLTNHDHEEIVESVEVYSYVARLGAG